MTQRSGKFTRGPCAERDGTCFTESSGGRLKFGRFVPIISPMRMLSHESRANAGMLAAALNAATAAEDMGYVGQAAVEALPELLRLLERARSRKCKARIDSLLDACRTKEPTP